MYDIEIKPCSNNGWFTPAEAKSYYGRFDREGITCHWWGDGTGASNHDNIVNYFMGQAAAGVKSVNFVCSDAKITQMVNPDNVAWCSTAGNPTTISIEFQPTLSDEGYKRGGWLIAYLEKKYGHEMKLYPHSHWNTTSCPGTIDIDRLRREANAVSGVTVNLIPIPTPSNPVATVASTSAQTVTLPASNDKWRWYPLGVAPMVGNEGGFLRPAMFGGLTYTILDRPQANVVTIQTQDYGKVNIWVAPDTGARFAGAIGSTTPPVQGKAKLVLPSDAASWRVYKVTGPWTVGNEVGKLAPSKFGGLTYDIQGNPSTNIYIINTQDFGQVAIYAGPDTGASFK